LKLHLFRSLAALSCGLALVAAPRTKIELKEGWYFLNGQKTLVNAIGYEPGARPGEAPYQNRISHLNQIRADLKLIKAAGYNGVRTWSEITEPELQCIQASGLKLVFGIGLQPEEDFADPKVVQRDLDLIKHVLAYSHKYDCVITYLIMNEPMPEHLHKVGAQATRDLWTQAVDLIHHLDPGVPVTFSGNAAITEWIDMNLFDVYGRNFYDYREGANYTHGFANAMRALTDSFKQGKPSLLTEFGLSVSRSGSGLYGSNTLQEQAQAMTKYYRDILDSGATGLCPFYFADGWWKGGNPEKHDDTAEEWFGFYGFRDLKDKVGYPRPAWHALKQYNQALVTSPKNQQFYQNDVPVEIFTQARVKKIRVIHQDAILLETSPDAHGHCVGKLSFPGEALQDRELIFESYGAGGQLLKTESLVVLTGKDPIQWPTLELRTSATDLEQSRSVPVEIEVKNNSVFSLDHEVRYAFSPHLGWDRAEARAKPLDPKLKDQILTDTYQTPERSVVLTIFAGTDIRFGKFVKTLYANQALFPGHWADPLRVK